VSVLTTYTLPVGGVVLSRGIAGEAGGGARSLNPRDDAARFCRPGLRGDPLQGQRSIGRDGDLTGPSLPNAKGRREAGFFLHSQTKVRANNSFSSS
jgi:hypothetical protein